jgi:serine/threonine-protein kinase
MTSTSREPDSKLDEIVAAYLESVEAGHPPDRQDLIAQHPELAQALADFFRDQDRFEAMLSPLSDSTPVLGRTARSACLAPNETPTSGQNFGDYELVEEVGRGGMGVVFKARHRQLHRVAAVKMILSGTLARPDEVQRFRLEAAAVAGLDHPNIVPLYEVGEQNGWHFYSMKFIEGKSLARQEWPRPLSPADQRQAARILLRVARAIHHAHERGVLHRDLKPANVLLDADGQPHVTDFGLAKRLADHAGSTGPLPTPSGTAVGTPSYMAPEQALGPRNVTTAADIYSLGCILYELLTGTPPFRAETPLATLLDVVERTPVRPAAHCPDLDRDLEIICLKCLEKEPGRRYATALALAEDLERFLSGEPIQARPAGRLERATRWCRRQPLLAGTLGALFLVVVGALALITWQWQRAETNYSVGQQHLNSLEQEKEEGLKLYRQAKEQRTFADERFQDAHALVDEFCMKLSEDRLSQLPGTQLLRKDLLLAARKYYQNFLKQKGKEPGLRLKLARAHYSLGKVLSVVGSRREAIHEFRSALELYEELVQKEPDNFDLLNARAIAVHRVGIMDLEDGRWGQAVEFCERARSHFEQLQQLRPGDPRIQNDLAATCTNLGGLYRGQGKQGEASACFERALSIRQELVDKDPKNSVFQISLAVTCFNYSGLLADLGKGKESLDYSNKACDINRKLARAHPKEPSFQRELALNLMKLSGQQAKEKTPEQALATLQEARALLEKLVAGNPNVVSFRRDLAGAERQTGHVYFRHKRMKEALASYQRARAIMLKAVKLQRDWPDNQNDLAGSYFDMATVLGRNGQYEDAVECYQEAVRLRERVVEGSGEHVGYRHDLSMTCNNLAITLWSLKRFDEALAAMEKACHQDEALVKAVPKSQGYRDVLSRHLGLLARFYREVGRYDEAEAAALKRARLWTQATAGVSVRPGPAAAEVVKAASELCQIAQALSKDPAAAQRCRELDDRALKLLGQAHQLGYRDRKALESDPVWESLRRRPEFQMILAEIG